MRCPTCRLETGDCRGRWRPFCSERCKMIDLGRWLDGEFAVPGEPATDEELAADLVDEAGEARGRRRRD